MKLRTRILLPSIMVSLFLLILGTVHYVQVVKLEQRIKNADDLENSFQSVFTVLTQKLESHFELSTDIWRSSNRTTQADKYLAHKNLEADITSYYSVTEKFLNNLPAEEDVHEAKKHLKQLNITLNQYFNTLHKIINDRTQDDRAKDFLFLQATRLKGQINQKLRDNHFFIREILHHFDNDERQTHLTHLSILWLTGFVLTIALTLGFVYFSSRITGKIQHVLERFAHLFPEAHIEDQEYQPDEALVQLEWFAQRLEDTQEELAASRTRFEKLISQSSTAIYVHRHMMPLYANEALVKLCGYDSAEELMSLPSTAELLAPHERRRVHDFHEARLRGEAAPAIYELEIIRKDAQPRWVLNKSFAFDWEGEPAICTTLIDITERKMAELELENSEDRFRILLELTPDPIFIYHKEGRILEVNTAACQALGYTRDELLLLDISDFAGTSPSDIPNMGTTSALTFKNGENFPQQALYQRKNGTTFPVEVLTTAGMLDHQSVLLSIAHDMTQTMAHILELDHMRQQAEKASEAKSDFLSMMSHELRTPLNSIIGYSNLYLQKAKDSNNADKHTPWIEQIQRSGQNLLEIVDKVLELIAIDEEINPDFSPSCCLNEIIAKAVETVTPLAEEDAITISNNISQDNPVYIRATARSLNVILDNLLSNAVKFNQADGHIDITLSDLLPHHCVLSITDTGQGIAPDQIARAFKPFERLGMENSTIPGSGIGLALVDKLCTQIGAKISVSSAGEAGCRFEITLPRALLT